MTNLAIAIPKDEIVDFCRRWQVTELALFGSVLREDFGPDSDVDLVSRRAVEQGENYIRRKSILRNLEVIHATR